MGEISDALKKSKEEERTKSQASKASKENQNPNPGSYHEALKKHAESESFKPGGPQAEVKSQVANFPERHIRVEPHRHLAMAVRSKLERSSAKTLAFASALRNEGKTTVTCNMAASLSSMSNGREVAVVDLDLRNPSVHRWLGIDVQVGLESFLKGDAELDEVVVHLQEPSLDVYPALLPQRNAHELLVTPLFESMIRHLEARYRTIVFDTPPCLIVPDVGLIMRHVQTCAVVARVGQSRVRRLDDVFRILPSERILGTILNGLDNKNQMMNYEYYGADADAPGQEVES